MEGSPKGASTVPGPGWHAIARDQVEPEGVVVIGAQHVPMDNDLGLARPPPPAQAGIRLRVTKLSKMSRGDWSFLRRALY
eukprot:2702732-Amphidinium_carterae.1